MSIRAAIEDLLAGHGPDADPAAVLSEHGFEDLPAEALSSALRHFAERASLDVADALSPLVTRLSDVPFEEGDLPPHPGADSILADGGSVFDLLHEIDFTDEAFSADPSELDDDHNFDQHDLHDDPTDDHHDLHDHHDVGADDLEHLADPDHDPSAEDTDGHHTFGSGDDSDEPEATLDIDDDDHDFDLDDDIGSHDSTGDDVHHIGDAHDLHHIDDIHHLDDMDDIDHMHHLDDLHDHSEVNPDDLDDLLSPADHDHPIDDHTDPIDFDLG